MRELLGWEIRTLHQIKDKNQPRLSGSLDVR